MKKTILILFVALMMAACAKDENAPTATQGTVRFTCVSENPYSCYVDGNYMGMVSGNSGNDYNLEAGTHTLKVVQVSGYVLYPTQKSASAVIKAGQRYEFIFP